MRLPVAIGVTIDQVEKALAEAKRLKTGYVSALEVEKQEYIKAGIAKAWFNKKPAYWEANWEGGRTLDNWVGDKWDSKIFWALERAEMDVAKLAILLTKLRRSAELSDEAILDDDEVALLSRHVKGPIE